MAEFVEFRAEEWVSELEQMERIRLFESKEVKTIASKRREFEYKLQRRTKCKEDYIKYIQFEIDLHRLVKGRREKTGIRGKIRDIEHAQTQRIAKLFKGAIFRFQEDIKLWMSFFNFCKDVKFQSLADQMIVRMLQIHSGNPDLWIFACNWELSQNKSVENARQFLMKGLRHHPSSVQLYSELFKLELENIKLMQLEKEKKIKTGEWVEDELFSSIINGRILKVVYKSAVQSITDADFKVTLLHIAKEYKNSLNIQNQIVKDLIKLHSEEEITWDVRARQELSGISYKISDDGESMEVDEGSDSLRQRIEKSVHVYMEGVEKIPTEKMWHYYVDFLIELNEKKDCLPRFKANLLLNAFQSALSAGKLAEKHFIAWVNMSQHRKAQKKTLLDVLKKATDSYPGSLKLWHSRLKHFLSRDQEEEALQLFYEAIKKVPNSLPLWKLMLQYLKCKDSARIEELFKKGMEETGEILEIIKPEYLEWLIRTKGIEEGRKCFDSPEMQYPPCLEVYNKMCELEHNQKIRNYKRIRQCRELAYTNFGQNNIDVWLESLKFEIRNGDPTKVDKIYKRALSSLEPDKADEFVERYNSLKTQRFKKFCEMFDIKV